MELAQKIKELRRDKKVSREELYKKLLLIFGEKTIKPNTIWRIESGLTSPRASSLHQICVGLGISLKDILCKISPASKLVTAIKKNKRLDQFLYNEKARAETLSAASLPFLAQELTILPQGRTNLEEDPIEIGKFQKWVYCLSGKITCHIGTEEHTLAKADAISFDSNLPHYFENKSSRKARCIVVQNPKHI